MGRKLVAWAVLLAAALAAPAAYGALRDTPHNMVASGPTAAQTTGGAADMCILCHTPAHGGPRSGALWNRELPPKTYNLYESSTLEAALKQPTGTSRLCLSCHDGTTALGSIRRPGGGRPPVFGRLTGRVSLGTDLSDDHPVSFVYDTQLALRDRKLADPATLKKALPLDQTRQLQCTTCHDPHDNPYRMFLRVDDRGGNLCTACHSIRNWSASIHAISPATWRGSGTNPWPESAFGTVADNACGNCHRTHGAPHPPRLLSSVQERGVCLVCHNGDVAEKDIESELLKPSAHPVASTEWTHEPREVPNTMPRHVTCVDCHNPHETVATLATAPSASGLLRGVTGVNIGGVVVGESADEYEVCLKCHGLQEQKDLGTVRQDNTRNVRLEISPGNESYHPVATVGRNPAVRGFEPGYTAASVISCTDCHNNDEWSRSGNAPKGPHGSIYPPLLEREYEANDPSVESFQTYALCYKCHNRDFLINDRANTFPHRKHVVEEGASCAACHDAHGSRDNPFLINFMRFDRTGKEVVRPVTDGSGNEVLEFVSPAPGRGECSLLCHGVEHRAEGYPEDQASRFLNRGMRR